MPTKTTNDAPTIITVPEFRRTLLEVPIIGETPLLMHAIGEGVRESLRGTGEGVPRPKKSKVRDIPREVEEATYRLSDGSYCFPAGAIKRAMFEVAKGVEGLTGAGFKRQLRVPAEMLHLEVENEPTVREDLARNQNARGALVLVYRPSLFPWKTTVPLLFDERVLPINMVIYLLQEAGAGIGIGAWRPDCMGDFGTFRVDSDNITAHR